MNSSADKPISLIEAARLLFRTKSPSETQVAQVEKLMRAGSFRVCHCEGPHHKDNITMTSKQKFIGYFVLAIIILVVCYFLTWHHRGYWNVVRTLNGEPASSLQMVTIRNKLGSVQFNQANELEEFTTAMNHCIRNANSASELYQIKFAFDDGTSCEMECYLLEPQTLFLSVPGYALEKHWPSHDLFFRKGSAVIDGICKSRIIPNYRDLCQENQ